MKRLKNISSADCIKLTLAELSRKLGDGGVRRQLLQLIDDPNRVVEFYANDDFQQPGNVRRGGPGFSGASASLKFRASAVL
jgi:hypothetical protein